MSDRKKNNISNKENKSNNKLSPLFEADFRYHDYIFVFDVECHFKIEKKCKSLK